MGRTACTEPQCLYKGTLYLYLYQNSIVLKKLKLERLANNRDKLRNADSNAAFYFTVSGVY